MVKAQIGRTDTDAHRAATRRWTGRFIVAGAFVGLPMSVVSAALQADVGFDLSPGVSEAVSFALASAGGPLMSLMYLSLVIRLCERLTDPTSPLAIAIDAIARLGRIGLTGYLASTLCMSVFMAHWGLGMFGQTTWTDRAVLVVLIYAGLLAFAGVWTRVFTVGPLEAVLRSATYLRWPWSPAPAQRTDASDAASGSPSTPPSGPSA
jgi:uncharacterized protein